MKQSTLAFVCGFILFVILAVSWCGRKPQPEIAGPPAPSQTLLPVVSAPPTSTPSPSAPSSPVAQASAAQPTQTPSVESRKVAEKVGPAVILVSVFDPSGQLLKTGTGFFISEDGRFVTNASVVEGGANAVAKSTDGKIRNVTGVLATSAELDLAVLRAETKTGVQFIPLSKVAEAPAGTSVAVVGSSLVRREQPLSAGTISLPQAGQDPNRIQISAPISSDALGAPVVDLDGQVVGVVTSSHGQGGATSVVRPAATVDSLLAHIKAGSTGRWAAAGPETPSPSPSPQASATPRSRAKIVYNPAPKYPPEARFSSAPIRGSGRYRVVFAANGEARSVQTVQSTGRTSLDEAALAALRQWKAEPGQEWTIIVPITFEP